MSKRCPFGSGGMSIRMNTIIPPTPGTKISRYSAPGKPPSWRRLHEIAKRGTIVPKYAMNIRIAPTTHNAVADPEASGEETYEAPTRKMIIGIQFAPKQKRATHQYSLRDARPEKVAYFLKKRLMASSNDAS